MGEHAHSSNVFLECSTCCPPYPDFAVKAGYTDKRSSDDLREWTNRCGR